VKKKKNETAAPQNNTFASSDTHVYTLQPAKELFFCQRTEEKSTPRHRLADLYITFDEND